MTVSRTDGVVLADSGLECDTFNVVCNARSPRIEHVLAHFGERPFSWWVGPQDEPENLGELLQQHGLERHESELGMYVKLDELTIDPALRIERARTPQQLMHYAQVNTANAHDEHIMVFYERVAQAALSADCPLRFYVGYEDHEPVATAECTLSGTTAGLYGVSTLDDYRGRGYGTAMTLFPLLDARRDGANVGILQASEAGENVYRRIGFREYGTFTEYHPGSNDVVVHMHLRGDHV
jgi:ribosomal protein S18 acetylase RimI-like enzyme